MGEVFASPSGEQVYRCTKAVATDAGVLYTYGNYSGDVLNFDMAALRCEAEGIDVRSVQVTDDVASAPKGRKASAAAFPATSSSSRSPAHPPPAATRWTRWSA